MTGHNAAFPRLKPLFDQAEKIIMCICKILLIGDILVTTISVTGRYIPFIDDPYWSEEVVLTQMVYMAVLSATLAIRKGSHIRMTAFDKYMSEFNILLLDLMADVAVCILGLLLLIYGSRLCTSSAYGKGCMVLFTYGCPVFYNHGCLYGKRRHIK